LTIQKNKLRELFMDSLIVHIEKISIEKDTSAVRIAAQDRVNRKAIADTRIKILKAERSLATNVMTQTLVKGTMRSIRDSVNRMTGQNFVVLQSYYYNSEKDPGKIYIHGKIPVIGPDKVWYFLSGVGQNFFGLLITAVALSLGAPFWFDLLRRLVAIRSAGVKPEEKPLSVQKAQESKTISTNVLSTAAAEEKGKDIVEEALRKYGPKIRAVAGVKSVFIFKDINTNLRNIQINVVDAFAHTEITTHFQNIVLGTTSIQPVIKITGSPVTHQGPGMIHHRSGNLAEGSFGCVLKRKDTGTFHILSCWHVMKDLSSSVDTSSIIDDHLDHELGDRWAGGIHGAFDYGIARCLIGASINTNEMLNTAMGLPGLPLKFRAVIQPDIDNQIDIKFVDFLSGQPLLVTGVIFTDSQQVEIDYPDKTRVVKDILVLTQSRIQQTAISRPGNSGAVIFDNRNKAIGMIIGGDSNFTYAIKISNIMSIHKELTLA
ncbi:MAG: hypothetical protein C0490_02645, partial [Marivirga sp.]|nr:hypothetical protein [Marivirga sp.]